MAKQKKLSLRERAEAKAEAENILLKEGESIEGIVFDASFADNLGGYKGRTPILYIMTDDGPVKFFAMHALVKSAVISERPQGGAEIVIVRGKDVVNANGDQTYNYTVAAENPENPHRVMDWGVFDVEEDE